MMGDGSSSVTLPGGAKVHVDEHRVRVDLPAGESPSYHAISSAIHNGGHRTLPASPLPPSYVNCKVPATYNGYDPSPESLLSNFIKKEGLDADKTVGLLTAASMKTLATASRSSQGVVVDGVVTAGLSNARSAGAEADWFVLTDSVEKEDNDADVGACNKPESGSPTPPGTINTLVIVNTPLTESARVEAYAIAVEAKCRACADHGVVCGKDPTAPAQGTGTDCCVLLCPATSAKGAAIQHAGKHTLFAELVGQAVHEATSEAIMINVRHLHGNYAIYTFKRWTRAVLHLLRGARPCIPPRPMMPVPRAPSSVIGMGACSVALAYCCPSNILSEKARFLLAAVAWDRYLGEPPLCVHPMAKFLERMQLDEARMQLSWLCSRDPSTLGSAALAGGTLESLSENLSDGFVAPLFWYVVLGPMGALGYRIINTLDSRVGYRGKFEWFGKPSARLDDVVNFIPARITALLLALAAWFVPGCIPSRGLATAWRDQSRCESPNAGYPMACFAGVLGVRLDKPGEYCLGTAGRNPSSANIRAGHRVAQLAGFMTLIGAVAACNFINAR
ncbi:hypothetical protein ACHAXT_004068 [Thalassiosira profunda]